MPLIQLCYCSKATGDIASTHAEIMYRASSRNKQNGITGCLAYCCNWFIQVIEGEQAVVEETFERIKNDSRHSDIRLMGRREIRGRSFPDWNMVGINLKEQSAQYLQSYGVTLGFDPEKALSSQMLLMLMDIADRKRMAI
ncbi:MAG: BLUF domain-containing protein [Beijerinckiaceae bacterium]